MWSRRSRTSASFRPSAVPRTTPPPPPPPPPAPPTPRRPPPTSRITSGLLEPGEAAEVGAAQREARGVGQVELPSRHVRSPVHHRHRDRGAPIGQCDPRPAGQRPVRDSRQARGQRLPAGGPVAPQARAEPRRLHRRLGSPRPPPPPARPPAGGAGGRPRPLRPHPAASGGASPPRGQGKGP